MLLSIPPEVSVPENLCYENCLHSRATFFECGIGITWFSCAREFFNAMMGALVGHFNGFVHRKVLQCDISDTNIWTCIPSPEPEFVVRNWPSDKGPRWYPKWMGLLGDWGYAMDVSGKTSSKRDHSCFITVSIIHKFTSHSIQHDLEAFVWLMWVLCINLDGPF
ncbi:hypothetical protein SCLCIDRAFT_110160, partial [Scleroderma citrinum Foug A]